MRNDGTLFRFCLSTLLSAGCLLSAETLKGKVVFVADGDTVTIKTADGSKEKIRLQGIDAPERDQSYGTESGKVLEKMVKGKTVTVKSEERDDYDRVLGTVYLNGKNINLELVKKGAAWHYKHYAPDNDALAKAEAAARKARAGLWKEEDPTAPWDFRHGTKTPAVSAATEPTPQEDTAATDEGDGVLRGECIRVADGDTLTIRMADGRQEKVQLFGIDAPETEQEHGPEAKAALESLVLGKQLRVTYPGREDLGRINGKVYVDGQYVNLLLVQQGHAWHSDKYGPNEEDLRAAQKEARAARKGLWAAEFPREPWRFRNGY